MAGQLLMLAPSEEPGVIQPPLVTATELADAAEPPQDRVIVTDVSEPIDGHEATVAKPPDAAPPAIAHDETAVAPERVVMALVQPTAMKPTAPRSAEIGTCADHRGCGEAAASGSRDLLPAYARMR